jgi:hypothetical protein
MTTMNRQTTWDNDDRLWALQVYNDDSMFNNGIYTTEGSSIRWGEGLPEWLLTEYPTILDSFKSQVPCGPHVWIDWNSINRIDEEDDSRQARLWVCRSYGTSPIAAPGDSWIFLGWFHLGEEQPCPLEATEEHDSTCPYCEGEDYIYHGSGYVLQVWAELYTY